MPAGGEGEPNGQNTDRARLPPERDLPSPTTRTNLCPEMEEKRERRLARESFATARRSRRPARRALTTRSLSRTRGTARLGRAFARLQLTPTAEWDDQHQRRAARGSKAVHRHDLGSAIGAYRMKAEARR